MKNPVEFQVPSSDHPPIILRMKEPRDHFPPAPLGDLSLYFFNSPVIESVGGRARNTYRRFNSRPQLIYRIPHGLTEVFQWPPVHPPVEGYADVGTG